MNANSDYLLAVVMERQADVRREIEADHLSKQMQGAVPATQRELSVRQLPELWKKAIRLAVPALAEAGEQ